MTIDVSHVAFSRYGSYYCFSEATEIWPQAPEERGIYLRTVVGRARTREIARVDLLLDGRSVPFSIAATPSVLRLEASAGRVEFCFAEPHVIYIRGVGVELELTGKNRPINHTVVFAIGEGLAGWNVGHSGTQLGLTTTARRFPAVVEGYRNSWKPRSYRLSFDDAVGDVTAEFDTFPVRTRSVCPRLGDLRELGACANRGAVVERVPDSRS